MIDLHMHSQYSEDGEFTPKELVRKCRERGVRVMSITDHNCARANAEGAAEAQKCGIRFIPGIEIDCVFAGVDFHVLGYGIDSQSADFARIETDIEKQNFAASLERLERTQALGFRLVETDLWNLSKNRCQRGTWTGELFAELLLSMPEYQEHPLLRPYRPGGSRSENPFVNFYWDYYSQGKPCYVEMKYPSMQETISLIHRNHGKAVLAHPAVNLKGKEELLMRICRLELDGIEAFSSYHTLQQAEYYCRQAAEQKLFVTCGSDFHGKTKPSIQLGDCGGLPSGAMTLSCAPSAEPLDALSPELFSSLLR